MGFIQRIFGNRKSQEPYFDSLLGMLQSGEEANSWATDPDTYSGPFAIEIGGTDKPDAALLAHAHDIHKESVSFAESVREFLIQQKSEFQLEYSDEIDSLVIEMVGLWWPARPNDGMIFFEGGSDGRVWRCDYINRSPIGLGFDS